MIIVEKVTFGHEVVAPVIKQALADYLKEKHNISDQKVIDEIFNKWVSDRTPDVEIKDQSDEELTKIVDGIESEFDKYIEEAIKEPEEEDKVSVNAEEFEKDFSETHRKNPKEALNKLREYLENKGLIRVEFLSNWYNEIYKLNPELSKQIVISCLNNEKNKLSSGLAAVLEGKDPKMIREFIQAMSFESLADGDNVFTRLLSDKTGADTRSGYADILSNDDYKSYFSVLFNISAEYEGDEDFKAYSALNGKPMVDAPIIANKNLYQIKNYLDISDLVKYDMSLKEDTVRRKNLNNAINTDTWQTYAQHQRNGTKPDSGLKTQKSTNDTADDFTKDLKGRDSKELENIFNRVLSNSGVNNPSLSKSIADSIVKAQQ